MREEPKGVSLINGSSVRRGFEMRRLIFTTVAAAVMVALTGVVNAAVYTPGIIVVEFADNVNLEQKPGTKGSGHGSLDILAEKYDVYEVEALYTMPKEPINHPHGLWNWEDHQRAVKKLRLKYLFAIRFKAKVDPVVVAEDYKKDVHVVNANAEGHGEAYMFPNDQYFDQQWYLYYEYNRDCDIHWPEAWDRFIWVPPEPVDGYPIVGVVDTGIYYSPGGYVHEDIRENIGPGWDMIGGEELPRDLSGHGTAVSGIIGADTNNYLGITGVSINFADIMPVRAFYDKPLDPIFTHRGIVRAVDMGADVVNMSWGYGYCPLEVRKALEHAWNLDRVTIASSGNNPDIYGPFYSYPAVDEDPRMISIGGTIRVPVDWERWPHSGWHDFTVDVVAPASPDIFSLWLDDGYRGDLEGTSYSCAMGSGIAAGCLVMLEGPYTGIDHHVRNCIHHGGRNWGLPLDEKVGYGTEYYDKALDRAIEIHDGGDGGSRALAAAAPALRLAQNAPNPATSSTTIRLELSSKNATRAELVIYDLSGRRVRAFVVPVRDGLAEVAWDLTTSAGARVAPGVYIYRVSAGGLAAAKKCVVH
jgi:hypothetical protein